MDGKRAYSGYTRDATPRELKYYLDEVSTIEIDESASMDVDSDTDEEEDVLYKLNRFPTPTRRSRRPYRILFVPDPTLTESSKERAKYDLAYVNAHIATEEFVSVQSLEPDVHLIQKKGISYSVLIQEWVRLLSKGICDIFNRINLALPVNFDEPIQNTRN